MDFNPTGGLRHDEGAAWLRAGALAGGAIAQGLFGAKLTMTVGIGYVACFGMAAATGGSSHALGGR